MSDHQRTESLYEYLVLCFANSLNRDGDLNRRALGRRLLGLTTNGSDGNRSAEKGRLLAEKLCKHKPITTGDLVGFIAGLQASGNPAQGQLLTPEEILIALQKLVRLTPEERNELGLSSGEEEVLLQQVLLNIWLDQKSKDYRKILDLYKTSIGLDALQNVPSHEQDLEAHISQVITQTTQQHLAYLPEGVYKRRLLEELPPKTNREIKRILLKAGAGQVRFEPIRGENYIRTYLPDSFIKRLAKAVIDNELLTQSFPIYIKTITIQECKPLPLTVSDGLSKKPGLFYEPLLEANLRVKHDDHQLQSKEVASQYAHKVTVHFYIRIPASYSPPTGVKDVFAELQQDDSVGQRIDFSMSSTGIGGTLSHIIKIINNTLLSDIPILSEYFPIAHDVVIHNEYIRNNVSSPVWAHTLAQLCKTKTLAKAMSESGAASQLLPYEQFAFSDCIGRGDYCGFDVLLCPANAALQARLRAIRYTGVVPEAYLHDLTDRILEQRCLQKAERYVTAYPFSSFAQESYLRETLLRDLTDRPFTQTEPYIHIKTCLTIAETYLDEGLYRRSKQYLEAIGSVLKTLSEVGLDWYERFGSNNQSAAEFKIFSGMLLVHFELCRALYFYLVDREAELGSREYLPEYIPQDTNLGTFHQRLLQESWGALNRAEKHLMIRLAKYFLIHEVSQGTFHPHYQLLAKIYFLRARILTFFPEVTYEPNTSPHRLPTDLNFSGSRTDSEIHAGRLYLLEKARLYAASDGDTERYSCYTAYQSWIYWITHFVHPHRRQDVLPKDCQLWARQLRDHALLSYAEIGRQCYYQIKEKSGVEEPLLHDLKNYEIGPIPAIIETRSVLTEEQQEDGTVLYLDMRFLAVRKSNLHVKESRETDESIYLFGPKASYLLFTRGMYQLCSMEKEEFSDGNDVKTVSDWDEKLKIAYRLFSYAWAMADAGGVLEIVEDNLALTQTGHSSPKLRIRRDFTRSQRNGYNRDVASVRDLYPNQISEMSDLGQVFAAVCLSLRLYTAPISEREMLNRDIDWLLQNLQDRDYCARQVVASQLHEQPRYNGHLAKQLDRCKAILQTTQQEGQHAISPVRDSNFVSQRRDILVRKLFNAMHTELP